MNLKKRFMNRLLGKDVDMTPVGSTTTYGMVELMKKCGAARPLADHDPVAMAKLAIAGWEYAGFEWVKAMGWDITAISEVFGCTRLLPSGTISRGWIIHRIFFKKAGSPPIGNNSGY
jgi:[methyl-Co(III) methanol-specific corrinoid protein]:coenzyme M methyltransferase